tara:strand:+ start:55 stop:753 length:699 start_codon:yes stop_codon:yes gene_type:complete
MFYYFSDEKNLFISYAKVATSHLPKYNLEKKGPRQHKFNDNFSEYENVFGLYREPYDRFFSGLIQGIITSQMLTPELIKTYLNNPLDFTPLFTNEEFWKISITHLEDNLKTLNMSFTEYLCDKINIEINRHCTNRLIYYKDKKYLYNPNIKFLNIKNLDPTMENLGYKILEFNDKREHTNSTKENLRVKDPEQVKNILIKVCKESNLWEEIVTYLKPEVNIFEYLELKNVSN